MKKTSDWRVLLFILAVMSIFVIDKLKPLIQITEKNYYINNETLKKNSTFLLFFSWLIYEFILDFSLSFLTSFTAFKDECLVNSETTLEDKNKA